jgi:hypothetical protein
MVLRAMLCGWSVAVFTSLHWRQGELGASYTVIQCAADSKEPGKDEFPGGFCSEFFPSSDRHDT